MKTLKINLIIAAWFVAMLFVAMIATSCKSSRHANCDAYGKIKWEDSIKNPENEEFVCEVAFNEGITAEEVTQAQFNARYLQ